MKIRIPKGVGGRGIKLDRVGRDTFAPGGKLQVNDYFDLVVFELSEPEVTPAEPVTVSWEIQPKRDDINLSDFSFSLFGPGANELKNLDLSGSTDVLPLDTSFLYIKGRKIGSQTSPLGNPLQILVNKDECTIGYIPAEIIDLQFEEELDALLATFPEIKRRGSAPLKAEWTPYDFRYDVPLKLVINNFFDADIDLSLMVTFSVDNSQEDTEFDVTVTPGINAKYSWAEKFFSFGAASEIEALVERLFPLIFRSQAQEVERLIRDQILSLGGVVAALEAGQTLLRVRPLHASGFEGIEILLCELPQGEDSPFPPRGPILDGGTIVDTG